MEKITMFNGTSPANEPFHEIFHFLPEGNPTSSRNRLLLCNTAPRQHHGSEHNNTHAAKRSVCLSSRAPLLEIKVVHANAQNVSRDLLASQGGNIVMRCHEVW